MNQNYSKYFGIYEIFIFDRMAMTLVPKDGVMKMDRNELSFLSGVQRENCQLLKEMCSNMAEDQVKHGEDLLLPTKDYIWKNFVHVSIGFNFITCTPSFGKNFKLFYNPRTDIYFSEDGRYLKFFSGRKPCCESTGIKSVVVDRLRGIIFPLREFTDSVYKGEYVYRGVEHVPLQLLAQSVSCKMEWKEDETLKPKSFYMHHLKVSSLVKFLPRREINFN